MLRPSKCRRELILIGGQNHTHQIPDPEIHQADSLASNGSSDRRDLKTAASHLCRVPFGLVGKHD